MTILRLAAALILAGVLTMPSVSAHPRHHHHHHHRVAHRHPRWNRDHRESVESGEVVGGRPRGCPYEFCGCEASLFLFHVIVAPLNLAANWLHFPHVSHDAAEPGDAAVAPSRHHVLVLQRHVSGPWWVVHDGNSGHHLTREHVRSIAGFTVVNPRGHRYG